MTDKELTPEDLDAMGAEDEEASPDLTQLIERAMRSVSKSICCSSPALAHNASMQTGLVDARLALARPFEDEEPINPEVPLLQLAGSHGGLQIPISSGDPLLLIYSDRSLDGWLKYDGRRVARPADPRAHDPTDALALPAAPAKAVAGAEDATVLWGDDVRLGSPQATERAVHGDAFNAALSDFLSAVVAYGNQVPPIHGGAALATAATTLLEKLPGALSSKVKVE